jgi:hypothetical protein
MSTERIPLDDKALWRSLAADRPVAPVAVSDTDFAAWLEGGLPEAEAARIDAAVAADPVLRQAALDLADILGKPLPPAPARMAVRAQALVGVPAERPARRGWLASLLPDFTQGFGMQRGALAATAMVVATVGFVMGGGLGQHFEEAVYASSQSSSRTVVRPLGRDTTGELTDLFTDAT